MKMKRIAFILIAIALAVALCACTVTPAAPTSEPDPAVGMPNPITEYGSLEEINDIVGMKLAHPPVMGVTDERFSIIDAGETKIAEYVFKVAGVEYDFRGSPSFDGDISGYYTADQLQ